MKAGTKAMCLDKDHIGDVAEETSREEMDAERTVLAVPCDFAMIREW
jgi:hypothetical protein